jgi:hypothetical protein
MAICEVISYTSTDYKPGNGAVIPWMVIDALLVWRIWRRSQTAWSIMLFLNVAVLALIACVLGGLYQTGQSGAWLVERIVLTCAEILILAMPRMRGWVSRAD